MLVLLAGCRPEVTPLSTPDVRAPADPQRHAVALPPPAPFERRRPVVESPLLEVPEAPEPVAEIEGPPAPVVLPGAEAEAAKTKEEPKKDLQEAAREVADAWLMKASLVTPGCLLGGPRPDLPLPSPFALAHILSRRPPAFAGVAREALVCLLELPQLTSAEVYGATAFTGRARAVTSNMGGSDRPQGVLVASLHTDNPPGDGTLVLAMDQRGELWTPRAAIYRPWLGDPVTRRIVSVTSRRLMHGRRRGLVVKQRDRVHTNEMHLQLTVTEQLTEALSFTSAASPPGGPKTRTKLTTTGNRWPRGVVLRSVQKSTPAVFAIEHWEAEKNQPYTRVNTLRGTITLPGAAEALEAGDPATADWIVTSLPKAEQRTAQAYRLRAMAQGARKRWRKATRFWKKAVAAKGSPPEIQRDYGMFLARRKKKRQAKKALQRYLERAPDAPDRALVEHQLSELSGR